MRPSIVIVVEGVVQKMITTSPIPAGISLYRAFSGTHNIVLVSEYAEKGELENWLILENLQAHGRVVYNDDLHYGFPGDGHADARRVAQVNRLARQGHDIHFVIEPDPAVAKALLEEGYNTLLCSYYAYAYPEWLPDVPREVRPWDELVAAIDARNKIRATDERVNSGEE